MLTNVDFSVADPLDAVRAALGDFSSVSNVSLSYTGADEALFIGDDLQIDSTTGAAPIVYGDGVLLSSGDSPEGVNDESSHSFTHGTPGDPDLTDQARVAFPGAGESQDAAILTLSFDVPAGSDISSARFSIGFGSEEYPEFNDTQFVDIGAAFAGEDNYAVFNNDPTQLLSINSDSLVEFIDNTEADWEIEYDGFTQLLTINVPVVEGANELRFGVADTGDTILDSGLFVGNISFNDSAATGVFVPVTGGDGDDELMGGAAPEFFDAGAGADLILPGLGFDVVNGGDGADTVMGTAEELDGLIIEDFTPEDLLVFTNALFDIEDVEITMGSAILDVDTDGDGTADSQITMEGDFEEATFGATQNGGNTEISYQLQADDDDSVDGGGTAEADDDDDDDDGFGGIGLALLLLLGLGGAALALGGGGL